MTETVAAKALGELIGVSARTVTDLAKRGIVIRAGDGFDLKTSIKNYCDHLRRLAIGRGGEAVAASAAVDRGRLARAQAEHVELKNARARGTLLDAGAVEAEWSGVLRTVRAGMLAVPSRVAARLPHLSAHDAAEIDAEVRAALSEFGDERPAASAGAWPLVAKGGTK